MLSPRCTRAPSSSEVIQGVCFSCSMTSPKALLGTLVPLKISSPSAAQPSVPRSEEHTSELQSPCNLVCRLLLEKKKTHRRKLRDPSLLLDHWTPQRSIVHS